MSRDPRPCAGPTGGGAVGRQRFSTASDPIGCRLDLRIDRWVHGMLAAGPVLWWRGLVALQRSPNPMADRGRSPAAGGAIGRLDSSLAKLRGDGTV